MQEANTYRAAKGGRGTENGERDTACPVLPTHHFVRLQRRQRQQQQHKNEGKRIKCLSYYSVNSILCIYGNQPNQFQRPLLLCTVSTIRVHWLANIVITHKRKKEKKRNQLLVSFCTTEQRNLFLLLYYTVLSTVAAVVLLLLLLTTPYSFCLFPHVQHTYIGCDQLQLSVSCGVGAFLRQRWSRFCLWCRHQAHLRGLPAK